MNNFTLACLIYVMIVGTYIVATELREMYRKHYPPLPDVEPPTPEQLEFERRHRLIEAYGNAPGHTPYILGYVADTDVLRATMLINRESYVTIPMCRVGRCRNIDDLHALVKERFSEVREHKLTKMRYEKLVKG